MTLKDNVKIIKDGYEKSEDFKNDPDYKYFYMVYATSGICDKTVFIKSDDKLIPSPACVNDMFDYNKKNSFKKCKTRNEKITNNLFIILDAIMLVIITAFILVCLIGLTFKYQEVTVTIINVIISIATWHLFVKYVKPRILKRWDK